MKYLFSLISIIFFVNTAFCQEERHSNNFFFTTEFDSLGVCYGKCLVQPKIDTTKKEVILFHEYKKVIPFQYYDYDTITLEYLILNDASNAYDRIKEYADTFHITIKIKDESRRLLISPVDYEVVTEYYLANSKHPEWQYENGGNFLEIKNWIIKKPISILNTRTKKIIRTTGSMYEEIFPAEYKTAIKVTPKKEIEDYQLNNLKVLCKNYFIQKTLMVSSKESELIPAKIEIENEYHLVKPARYEFKKTICTPKKTLITKLQKQLYALGFYQGNFLGEFNNKTKEAIIKYQLKHKLPFGQLTKETVNHILSQETHFNK